MTDAELDKLESAAKAATPDLWVVTDSNFDRLQIAEVTVEPIMVCKEEDAEYICASNPLVILSMIDELRRVRKERDTLSNTLQKIAKAATPGPWEEAPEPYIAKLRLARLNWEETQ